MAELNSIRKRKLSILHLLLMTTIVAFLLGALSPAYSVLFCFMLPALGVGIYKIRNPLALVLALLCLDVSISGPIYGYARIKMHPFTFIGVPARVLLSTELTHGFSDWYNVQWEKELLWLGIEGNDPVIITGMRV